MRVSRLAALPVSVVLGLGLAACGGAAPAAQPSPSPTVSAVETPTPSPTPTVEELSAANLVARTAAAEAAVTSYDVSVTVTGAITSELTGSADLSGGKRNAQMHLTDPDLGAIELRLVDGLLYANLGEVSGGLFLQVDPNDASNPLAQGFAGFEESLFSSEFTGLEQAIVSVARAGAPEVIDGVETQPYTVVVDTAKITPETVQSMLEEEGVPALPATITYTYWIDGQDLIRKSAYELGGSTTTVLLTKMGAGTPVTAPPAEQVTTEMPF